MMPSDSRVGAGDAAHRGVVWTVMACWTWRPRAVRAQAFGAPLTGPIPLFSINPRCSRRAKSFETWP